jgi:hypothetical protein
VLATALVHAARANDTGAPLSNPSASSIYTRMVLAMQRESPPTTLAYRETFTPNGLTIQIGVRRREAPRPQLVFAPNAQVSLLDVTQGEDGISEVTDRATGSHFTGTSLFWAPTWSGVHTSAAVSAAASPLPVPPASSAIAVPSAAVASPAPSEDPGGTGLFASGRSHMVADVLVISDRYYAVTLADDQVGDASTYHLHLVARRDPAAHPLTDLYVDRQTYLLRTAAASFRNEAYVSGFSGTMRLDFGRVQSYWMVTGGLIDASAHVFFQHLKGSVTFAISDVIVQALNGQSTVH